MKSRRNAKFRKAFNDLPASVQEQARKAYRQFKENPAHPGLQFKLIHPGKSVYSVRISLNYRALGVLKDDLIVWFWIGPHAEYDGRVERF